MDATIMQSYINLAAAIIRQARKDARGIYKLPKDYGDPKRIADEARVYLNSSECKDYMEIIQDWNAIKNQAGVSINLRQQGI